MRDYWSLNTQMLDARKVSPEQESYSRFYSAMLMRATEDYEVMLDYLQGFTRDPDAERLFRTVEDLEGWFFNETGYNNSHTTGLSLAFLCDGLNISIKSVRLELSRWRRHRIVSGKRLKFLNGPRAFPVRHTKVVLGS